jgi:beta-glucoside operon transcriptional antiterminator
MRAIKKINNNVALCLDQKGNELIAFGKGIGFPEMPYEIEDLSSIERTFYHVSDDMAALLADLPQEYLEEAVRIVDYAGQKLPSLEGSRLVFALADHISFAVERTKKGILVRMPGGGALKASYPKEMAVADEIRQYLNRRFHVRLPADETVSLCMHLIEAESSWQETKSAIDPYEASEEIIRTAEEIFGMKIRREGFNYGRFLTHVEYLVQRKEMHEPISSDNEKLYASQKEESPQAWQCAQRVKEIFARKYDWKLDDEELLYLMLHINRLTSRESNCPFLLFQSAQKQKRR